MASRQAGATVGLRIPNSQILRTGEVMRTKAADPLSRLIQFVVLDDRIVFFDSPEDLLFFIRVV